MRSQSNHQKVVRRLLHLTLRQASRRLRSLIQPKRLPTLLEEPTPPEEVPSESTNPDFVTPGSWEEEEPEWDFQLPALLAPLALTPGLNGNQYDFNLEDLVGAIQNGISRKISKTTLATNGTREHISELTRPMADISQNIRTNISLCKDRMQELKVTRLSGDQLRKRLHLKKIILKPETLDKPRTMCHHIDCTDFKDDSNNENKVVTVYKSHCHSICYLTDVKPDQIAHPGLINCAAFGGTQKCKKCNHKWNHHLHVLYELKEETANVTDSEIEKQLRAHADDVTLKQTAIQELQNLIREYRHEHERIQRAAAQFGIFLWKYSITPYNDATLSYLDFLIKDEEAKVHAGGNRKKLDALREDYQKHEEMVMVLKLNMKQDVNSKALTEEEVDKLVKKLYSLKHFGKQPQERKADNGCSASGYLSRDSTSYQNEGLRIIALLSGKFLLHA